MTPAEAAARSRPLLRLAALLGVALVAVLVNAVLQGGGSDRSENPIRAAALRTEREPGGHAATEAIYSQDGAKVAATGSGVFDFRSGRGRATFVVPTAVGIRQTVHAVVGPDEDYLRSTLLNSQLQPAARWLGVEPWLGRNQEVTLVSRWSPPAQMRMLAAVGDEVEDLGSEDVLGVSTEHYGGHLDLADYARRLASAGQDRAADRYRASAEKFPLPIRVEVWVDDSGRLRRFRTVTSLEAQSGHEVTVDTRTDLTGFGPAPKIELPPASEVLDISPAFRWLIDAGRGKAYGDLSPRGPELSVGAFQRRASALCLGIDRKETELERRSRPAEAGIRRLEERSNLTDRDHRRIADALRILMDTYYAPFIHAPARFVRRLAALRAPASKRAMFEQLIRVGVLEGERAEAEIRLSQLGEFGLVQEVEKDRKSQDDRGAKLSRQLGLDACVKPLGPPPSEGGAGEPTHETQPTIN